MPRRNAQQWHHLRRDATFAQHQPDVAAAATAADSLMLTNQLSVSGAERQWSEQRSSISQLPQERQKGEYGCEWNTEEQHIPGSESEVMLSANDDCKSGPRDGH